MSYTLFGQSTYRFVSLSIICWFCVVSSSCSTSVPLNGKRKLTSLFGSISSYSTAGFLNLVSFISLVSLSFVSLLTLKQKQKYLTIFYSNWKGKVFKLLFYSVFLIFIHSFRLGLLTNILSYTLFGHSTYEFKSLSIICLFPVVFVSFSSLVLLKCEIKVSSISGSMASYNTAVAEILASPVSKGIASFFSL